ncbi:MAG: DUF2726 domain-containing protein [Candidatus Peregrinibacteria bacterium]
MAYKFRFQKKISKEEAIRPPKEVVSQKNPVSDIRDFTQEKIKQSYCLQKNFLGSGLEFRVFQQLRDLLKDFPQYYIFPQAPMREFIEKKMKDWVLQAHINQKNVDFLVCENQGKNFVPALVVEVQGPEHDKDVEFPNETVLKSDDIKAKLFNALALKCLRIHLRNEVSDTELHSELDGYLRGVLAL